MQIISDNPRARFDYFLKETLEAGLVLTGSEVKSAKNGSMTLKGSFVVPKGNELFLVNAHISPYLPGTNSQQSYDPRRSRKLLVHKKDITRLIGASRELGLTLIPTKVYIKHRLVKVEIALGKGKKKYDKRATIKERELNRAARAAIKR